MRSFQWLVAVVWSTYLAVLIVINQAWSVQANGIQLGPSVNHQGVWIPNPVAQVEHHVQSQINSLKYKYSLRHLKDRAKHNAMQHSSLARMILEAPRKFHNIQNAIKY